MRKFVSYSLIVFILFISSGSSALANDKTVIVGGWLFFTLAHLFLEKSIKFLLLKLLGIFAILSIFYYLKNGGYDAVTYLGFFIRVCLAYYCRDICKENFFPYFVKTVFVATCISIPLFTIQLINFDFLYSINHILSGYNPISNSVIFSMVPIHAYRNCGFMWEPGAFAGVLILTFYINTFREGESLFSTKNKVFILAILTTQSTMGFLSLLIPIGLVLKDYFSNSKLLKQLSFFIVPILLVVFYLLFNNVPFLAKKMANEIEGIDEELAFIEKGQQDNFVVAVTRTTSLLLDMETIKRYPILGLGIDMQTTGRSKQAITENTITACGTTTLMVRFGLVGLIFYFFMFYDKAFFENKTLNIGWAFLIFFVLFSNDLSGNSLFHLFVFKTFSSNFNTVS